MRLSELRKPIINEIWRSPTRVLKRVNAGSVRATSSELYSNSNTINPQDYFKKS